MAERPFRWGILRAANIARCRFVPGVLGGAEGTLAAVAALQCFDQATGADQYALEADHVVQSVRVGRLLPPVEDGRAQARAVEALYLSAETGQAVRL